MAANVLERYGIKEVADVTFYKINKDGSIGAPVLYLDSLKVSTLEQTGDIVYAQGGKGNSRLIAWDTDKAVTVTLEDALFSPKSMAIMFGDKDGTVDTTTSKALKKTIVLKGTEASGATISYINNAGVEATVSSADCSFYDATGSLITGATTIAAESKVFVTFDITANNVKTIEISPNKFPGTYYITGDTYARNETTGDDECFQFIIHKGKITSENTITMEADGDPSTFSMNVECLRATKGNKPVMIELVQYDLN